MAHDHMAFGAVLGSVKKSSIAGAASKLAPLSGAAIGGALGAASGPEGHVLQNAGRGAVRGVGTQLGVGIGGLGGGVAGGAAGALSGAALGGLLSLALRRRVNPKNLIPGLSMAGGQLGALGGLGAGMYHGGRAGYDAAGKLMGPASYAKQSSTGGEKQAIMAGGTIGALAGLVNESNKEDNMNLPVAQAARAAGRGGLIGAAAEATGRAGKKLGERLAFNGRLWAPTPQIMTGRILGALAGGLGGGLASRRVIDMFTGGEKKAIMVGGTVGALGGLATSKKNKRGLGAGRGALIGAGTELGVYPGAAIGGVGGLALGGLISALAQRHAGMRVPDMLAGGALGAGLGAAGGGYLGNIASRALLDDSSHSKQDEKSKKKDEETKEAGLAELGAGAKSMLARVKSQFGKLRPQKGGVTAGPKATPQSSVVDDYDAFVPRQYPGKKPQQPTVARSIPAPDDYDAFVPRQYPGKKPQQPTVARSIPTPDDYDAFVPRQVPRHSAPYDPAIHGRKIFNDVPATKEAFMGAAGKAIASGVASAGKGLASMAGKYLPAAQKTVTNAANTAGQAMFGTPGRAAATGIGAGAAAGVGLGVKEQNRINNQVDYQRQRMAQQRMAQQPMPQQPMQQQPMKAAMFGALLGQLAAQKTANAGAPTLGARGSAGPRLANSGQVPGSASARMLGPNNNGLLGPGGAMMQKLPGMFPGAMQKLQAGGFTPGGQGFNDVKNLAGSVVTDSVTGRSPHMAAFKNFGKVKNIANNFQNAMAPQ